jgi:hypothetical protein
MRTLQNIVERASCLPEAARLLKKLAGWKPAPLRCAHFSEVSI